MFPTLRKSIRRHRPTAPWNDPRPVRSELFGVERLEQHAASLAVSQAVTDAPVRTRPLQRRLDENASVLLSAYRASAADMQRGRTLVPAAEWLLDNYQLVEAQIREVRGDLPPGYYRQLPRLADGPFAGYPRVFGLTWAYVAHTDSDFDPEVLRRFLVAYQRVQPLTIGELWAVSITLRIVLIENLRRIADQITGGQTVRSQADALADRMLAPGPNGAPGGDPEALMPSTARLSERLAAQLAKRLRDQDPRTTPALGWLEERLHRQGTTIDETVQRAQQRQGASNVTVRNIITSLRLIAAIDWADLFEEVSPVDARLRAGSAFGAMDLPTRNLYRNAIEQLARGATLTELEVADCVLQAAAAAGSERAGDPGYHLIAEGRPAIEHSIGFTPTARLRLTRSAVRLGIAGYAGSILSLTALLLLAALALLAVDGVGAGWLVLLAVIGFLPATDLAAALVNRAVTWAFGATSLPGLDVLSGVTEPLRTLVVVPTLLTSEADLLEQVAQLEVHHLSGASGDMAYALLTDGMDAGQEEVPDDAPLLAVATAAIGRLNRRHDPAPSGPRFLLLHRRRRFNASEGTWMGWERKRGKLHELNRLLRGATDTSYVAADGTPPQVPDGVRYVITLDGDTRLPRDSAARLIGKMGHPLNRPRLAADGAGQRVVGGHAILQPRVTPLLSRRHESSLYQFVFAGPGGMDPYSAAVSDVYQDLFGEGSYTGKGIYDVDAFEAALDGRIPDNALLSHDLFEGIFAHAGLATDVEVVEEFPSRYDVAVRRLHRWTRGDWQLLPWVLGPGTRVPPVGRWKMFDNLRRSLHAPFTLLSLVACWLLPWPADTAGVLLVLASVAIPAGLPVLLAVLPVRKGVRWRYHAAALAADVWRAALHAGFTVAFLPDQAWRMGDAVVRTLVRVFRTRRRLLEWTTAAQAKGSRRLDVAGFYLMMAPGTLLGVVPAAVAMPHSPVAAVFGALWLLAPALAFLVSQPRRTSRAQVLPDDAAHALRLTARRTWRYFETFVTPHDNMLPPDNFQEEPKPVVAHRTSPTNLGLYLLSTLAAHDFGWTGSAETVERLEAALAAMQRLPRFRGHFYNWYETADMRLLEPAYVSSVDSGNLAGHLLVLANACETWATLPDDQVRLGLRDTLDVARAAFSADAPTTATLDEIEAQLRSAQSLPVMLPVLQRLAEAAAQTARDQLRAEDEASADPVFWMDALLAALHQHGRDRLGTAGPLDGRLLALAATARAMAMDMEFAFLVDPERKLLSIGYNVDTSTLDHNCYDLLASEARLASLFAIAKGDLPTRHWFRLGRTATPVAGGSALVSWAGSMFEYLMPALVMEELPGSQLGETNRLVVQRQQSYAREVGTPWGISESAYNARDLEFTYQYSTFGVPGLGLRRGLGDSRVIAPYATGLAAMLDPRAAQANYARLAELGGAGRHGFYEALDFTPGRVPEGQHVAVVRNYMVHHQGMTIAAIANVLLDGRMRRRFHREPMIQASELLLQERVPRNTPFASARLADAKATPATRQGVSAVRRVRAAAGGAPVTSLLSNGRYAVMLTASGAGYSRWRDIAVTRWREDPTLDDWGSFILLRDPLSARVWSAGAQPAGPPADGDVLFAEDHAEFSRRDGTWTTTMDVLVSGEADGEIRRVSVTNGARRTRLIELTSYAELVLATPATDNAHPAFAKLFVQTEYVPEYGALLATRRPRAKDEAVLWAAHFTVVDGNVAADPQYETDRARFLGRGRTVAAAAALTRPLTNTAGTVLDPVFSLRQLVSVPPGQVGHVAFWTLVAPSRAELLSLVDKHNHRNAYDRARTLAWTQAQVELRFLGIDGQQAADFQRLAAPIVYADRRFRSTSDAIMRGAGPQSGLWPLSISGDLPIVLLRIDDLDDMAQVRQLLQAHEYWRMKRLAVDLVIVNEHRSSYLQDLQIAIETAVRTSQSSPRPVQDLAQGSVYALRADLIGPDARALLLSVARVVLIARRGPIAAALARIPKAPDRALVPPPPAVPVGFRRAPVPLDIEVFNGFGGFVRDGQEYLTVLNDGRSTPAPWINVIANPDFGFQVSAEGSGYTWAENSRENQVTPWSNDAVADPPGEAFYVTDAATGEVWTPTALPVRGGGVYTARHGHGYSRFGHTAHGIDLDLLQFVPLADPIKISRLTVRNASDRPRRLKVTAYAEWSLGRLRSASAAYVTTEQDASGAMLARNPWNGAFPGRVAFADMAGQQTAWTTDRTEFLGRDGTMAAPAALRPDAVLSGRAGGGLDPCVAQQRELELAPGQSAEVVWFLGQCQSVEQAQALVARYRAVDLNAVLAEVAGHWKALLGTIQVTTPDRAMDIMLNGWLLYQTLACRIWARSAFYQSSGAYGFRDQLQDGMALTFATPDLTRHHILRAAGRQFIEGDVQHWWLPHSGQGVRTHISDDRVWLAFATATYVATAGDPGILDEAVPFLDGPALKPGVHDAFFQPETADETASLYEHCARGLDQCMALTGAHGLPLMGTGDWNDGMNRVGEDGRGESVWLGWLLLRTIALFAPLTEARDPARAERWRAHAASVRAALERDAWDGDWYRRATFDDGTWLGSAASEECRIDSIAQSWAVLSGAADPARAAAAMAAVDQHLIRRDDGLALLFSPPFDKTHHDPGYIKGYPPGLRENGGQYSHAAMWAILAFARLGDGTRAAELFALVNPVNHARSPADAERYKVEPYVVAADVYSVPPHNGRGGWTWYTGSAGWMYRAGVEGILGIRREGDRLMVDPELPSHWPGYDATIAFDGSLYKITVVRAQAGPGTVGAVTLDGMPVEPGSVGRGFPLDGRSHDLRIQLLP